MSGQIWGFIHSGLRPETELLVLTAYPESSEQCGKTAKNVR